MRLLDRYLLRELFVPFLVGTLSVVLMFQINTYIFIGKNFNTENIPFRAILQYILYMTPSFMRMTLPVGTALATSLAMTRIAREAELTSMRAAGIGVLRVIRPIALFGVLVAVGNFVTVERIAPVASAKARSIGYQFGIVGMASSFRSNAFVSLGKYSASFGSVERTPDDKLQINDVMLVSRPKPGQIELTTAKTATYDRGVWRFRDSYQRLIQGEDMVQVRSPGEFVINERIVLEQLMGGGMEPEEQTIAQVREAIASGRKLGNDVRKLEVDLANRYAVPASCFLFALISPAFAVFFARSGGFLGVLLSMGMVLLYYNAYVICSMILAKQPWCPTWVAAWLPNMLFGIVGLWAIRRLE